MPANTFGMASAADALYVFGSASTPAGLPAGVSYQQLLHPDGVAMTELLSYDLFTGKIYAAAKYSDGSIHHFYNGARVTDWDDGVVRAAMVSNGGIALHLKSLINGMSWAAGGGTYAATVAGSTVTVTKGAPFTTVSASTENAEGGTSDQTLSVGFTSGATVATFAVGGTFEVNDRFTIKLDGTKFGAEAMPTGKGTIVRTHKRKIYSAVGSILNFSGLDTATGWNRDDDAGAGFINFADQQGGAEQINALANYQNNFGLLARRVVQLWAMQNDETANAPFQVLANTGARAAKAARQYGDVDTFYLSDTGVRSLRARDVTNTAAMSDVGTPIDAYILAYMGTLTDTQIANASATVEPIDGRFILALGTKAFVFSYFPAKKISAWTWYELDFEISDFAIAGNRLYARSGDKIYIYGGDDNATYDNIEVTCWLPFFSARKHGTFKQLKGIDIAAQGLWHVVVLPNPNDLNDMIVIGDMENFTFPLAETSADGHMTHMSVKLTKQSADYGSISMVGIFSEGAEESD